MSDEIKNSIEQFDDALTTTPPPSVVGTISFAFPESTLAHPSSAAPLPEIPGYEILGELGHGAMGVVYRARHVGLKRIVALKMIRGGAQIRPEWQQRFRREAE